MLGLSSDLAFPASTLLNCRAQGFVDSPASLPASILPPNVLQCILRHVMVVSLANSMSQRNYALFAPGANLIAAGKAGFRFGAKGTHTSRTIMFAELDALFEAT